MCQNSQAALPVTYYRIATHALELSAPDNMDIDSLLPNFAPFRTEPKPQQFSVKVKIVLSSPPDTRCEYKLLSDLSVIMDDRFRFEESSDRYRTSVITEGIVGKCEMLSTKDFSRSTIYIPNQENYLGTRLSWLIMVAFGQAVLPYRTILLHASVIRLGEEGIAFLGKSGTGKSTHSRLWLANIKGSELLNDDNPVLHVAEDRQVYIYGSPWSGKTPCYKPIGVCLKNVIRLQQAPENTFRSLSEKEALLAMLPSASAIRWNAELFGYMLSTLQDLVKKVPVGQLRCLPDRDAAQLCYQEAFL